MPRIQMLALSLAVLIAAATCVSADVQLTLRDGRVSISAKDATVAEILAEWARVGQIRILNADALPGERVTIELQEVAEDQALAVLLRKAAGYLAAPRPGTLAGASRFDRILVMRVTPPPAPVGAHAVEQPAAQPVTDPADATDPETTTGDANESGARDSSAEARLRAREKEAAVDDPSVAAALQARTARGLGASGAAVQAGGDAASAANPAPAASPSYLSAASVSVPAPPVRPMPSGQMSERRAAAASAVPRDRPAPPAQDPAPAVTDGPGMDPSLLTPVALPPQDPQAQEAFKHRQAVEVADPRTFKYVPAPPVPGSKPLNPGAAKPGVVTKGPGVTD